MPISREKFREKGKPAKRRYIQDNIMLILRENPDVAISSKEFGDILDATPQTINQALRSLEDQGRIVRGFVLDPESGQLVSHAMEAGHAQMVKEKIQEEEGDRDSG